MEDFKNVERWTLEDGRRAERRVTENKIAEGEAERVTELHVEDERPLRLEKRVVEKTKPIIYERKIETIDRQTGAIVDQKVEAIEPKVQMQLIAHSVAKPEVVAQSINEPLTKDDIIEAVVAAVRATQPIQPKEVAQPKRSPFVARLNSAGLADEIDARSNKQGYSLTDKFAIGLILALVGGLVYIMYFLPPAV